MGAHKVDHFRYGSEPLDDWIKTRARANQASGASRTWAVLDGQVLAAYEVTACASIIREAAPKGSSNPDPGIKTPLKCRCRDHRDLARVRPRQSSPRRQKGLPGCPDFEV